MLLNKIAQLFAINAKLICMVAAFTIIFNRQDIGIYSNGSNGISILGVFLNEALQSIFINTNYIILIIQTATAYAVIYSNDSMTGFCSSNSVIIMLLNKIDQLFAVDINLIRMVAIDAFIGDFQHIGFRFYGSNSIGPGNVFQLLVYPALRSNTVYAAGVNSASIISNIGSQRAVCKGQFIASNLGIGINNGCSKYPIISSYQLIGIDCLPLTGSCSNRFNNSIFQAYLTCFTVNGLRHGDIIGIERFDNSVKFTYRNLRHRLLALHFGIITCMYRSVTIALRIPLIILSMINKRCEQFNLLAGADLYLRVSQICPEISGSIMSLRSINLSCSVFGNSLVNRRRGRRVSPNSSITHHAHCHNCCQHALCQSSLLSSLFHFQSPFSTLRHSDASLILVKSISLIKYNSDKVVLKFKALKI